MTSRQSPGAWRHRIGGCPMAAAGPGRCEVSGVAARRQVEGRGGRRAREYDTPGSEARSRRAGRGAGRSRRPHAAARRVVAQPGGHRGLPDRDRGLRHLGRLPEFALLRGAAQHRDLISPLYSPCITANCGSVTGGWKISWWHMSPGLLALTIPGGFRATCYYYRRPIPGLLAFPGMCGVRRPRSATARPASPHPPEPAPLLLRPGPDLQRHPDHRRRHGLPPPR